MGRGQKILNKKDCGNCIEHDCFWNLIPQVPNRFSLVNKVHMKNSLTLLSVHLKTLNGSWLIVAILNTLWAMTVQWGFEIPDAQILKSWLIVAKMNT